MLDLIDRPLRAARALKALLSNPDDTKEVFKLIDALSSGPSPRMSEKMDANRAGQRILADRPDLLARLQDRAALAELPEGSLGRAYLAFMTNGDLNPGFLVQASADGGLAHGGKTDDDYLGRRMRDQHDLWHVVTGYQGDLLGEASLLAFTFAQTWNLGIGVIVGAAFATAGDPDATRMFFDAFVRGARAAWLPAVYWEEMLELPLDEVRARLRVGPPVVYEPFWSKELPEGGVLAAVKESNSKVDAARAQPRSPESPRSPFGGASRPVRPRSVVASASASASS